MAVDGVNPNSGVNNAASSGNSSAQNFDAAASNAKSGDSLTPAQKGLIDEQLANGAVTMGQLLVMPLIQDILKK